ncbi:hypothetical protein PLANPX_0136 [Lacipirellula parvula]|uniref:Uncharacterized protein n=1 Tax=Lacipirellula parvula TaxID=2650471 RepID=A0A5K7X1K0_9BACT|nr:hypothetical protein PLANPX_0136 [Lacipirellula parvula]
MPSSRTALHRMTQRSRRRARASSDHPLRHKNRSESATEVAVVAAS